MVTVLSSAYKMAATVDYSFFSHYRKYLLTPVSTLQTIVPFGNPNSRLQISHRGFSSALKLQTLNHSKMSAIVQYVVVRGDLLKSLDWPVGAVIAQACHACTAVTHLFYSDQHTQEYLADLDNMHKVVLEAPDQLSLEKLQEKLAKDNICHKLWIEQPENISTCLVAKPYPKEQVQKYFSKFKLFKC